MGVEFVVIFISVIMLLIGLVLLWSGGDNSIRRVGFYVLMIGIIGILISIIAYPSDKMYIPAYQYSNESNNL